MDSVYIYIYLLQYLPTSGLLYLNLSLLYTVRSVCACLQISYISSQKANAAYGPLWLNSCLTHPKKLIIHILSTHILHMVDVEKNNNWT